MKKMVLAAMLVGMVASVALCDDLVDNPQYKAWSAYKVGTTVKIQMTGTTQVGDKNMAMKMNMTQTLKDLTAEKAVVEVVTETEMGGTVLTMPNQTLELPAKVAKDTIDNPKGPAGAKVTKKAEGDEEVAVGDKKYKCHWTEYETKGDQNEGTSKIWNCPDVPGGMVKTTTDSTKPTKSKTIIQVVEFKPA